MFVSNARAANLRACVFAARVRNPNEGLLEDLRASNFDNLLNFFTDHEK